MNTLTRPGIQVCYIKLRFKQLDSRHETRSLDAILVKLVWMAAAYKYMSKR